MNDFKAGCQSQSYRGEVFTPDWMVEHILDLMKCKITRCYGVNRFGEDVRFDEWTTPLAVLSVEAKGLIGITNVQLVRCRSTNVVLCNFIAFIHR